VAWRAESAHPAHCRRDRAAGAAAPLPLRHKNLSAHRRASARPPRAQVHALWKACLPVSADPEVMQWLCYRYCERPAEADETPDAGEEYCDHECNRFRYRPSDAQALADPATSADERGFCFRYRPSGLIEHIESWDLCRAIPLDAKLPWWACSRGGSWTQTGHRLLFPLRDHEGRGVSFRARCIDPNRTPKSLAPAGFSVRGLLLADPLGVQLLSGSVPSWWDPRKIIISEGEMDWMIWAGRQKETDPQGPACFAVEAGSWNQELASRIPDGSAVVLRTHHDPAGVRYAEKIAETLQGRCFLYRSLPQGGPCDER
jgi:hypothetical protein